MSIQIIVTIIVIGLVWAMLLYGLRTFLYARKYGETDQRMKGSFKRAMNNAEALEWSKNHLYRG